MSTNSTMASLLLFALLFLHCSSPDDDFFFYEDNVFCVSDCLIIYGSISPNDLQNGFGDSRLQVTRENSNGDLSTIAFTRLPLNPESYRISVPKIDLIDDLENINIGVISREFLPFTPHLPFADLDPNNLPDSIEIDLTIVPWSILNITFDGKENTFDNFSFELEASNGKIHEQSISGTMNSVEHSLLTYAETELIIKARYSLNGVAKEKSQVLTLPGLQDTSLEIILD